MPPRRCVVQDCERIADLELGISMHGSPPSGSVLTKWKKFVLTHRKTFSLTGQFGVCSLHFTRDCFTRAVHVEGTLRAAVPKFRLEVCKMKKSKIPKFCQNLGLDELFLEKIL